MDGFDTWTETLKINSNTPENKRRQPHHYTRAQFGLEAAQIRERFSGYIEDYDLFTPRSRYYSSLYLDLSLGRPNQAVE